MVAPRKPSAQPGGSLSSDDWLAVGYLLLAEEGIAALKIDRLCARAGVTRGSFYWHFETIGAFRGALAKSWTQALSDERDILDSFAGLEPRQRLATMVDWLMSDRKWTLERAMREWARGDDDLAAAIGQADRRVRHTVMEAFVDYGFADDAAALRADLMFSAGIGSMHLGGPGRMSTPERRDELLDLLLQR